MAIMNSVGDKILCYIAGKSELFYRAGNKIRFQQFHKESMSIVKNREKRFTVGKLHY